MLKADYFLQLTPGTNVAMFNAMAHVIVTEGLVNEQFVAARCEPHEFKWWREFAAEERNSPEVGRENHRRPGSKDSRRGTALRTRTELRDLLRTWSD